MNKNLTIVKRFYHQLWNCFDQSIIPTILHEELVFRGSLGLEKSGHKGFKEYLQLVQAAFPDIHVEIVHTISEGDKVFARIKLSGTHRGQLLAVHATQKKIVYEAAAVFTFTQNKIKEIWVLGDLYGLLKQLKT